MAYNKETGMWEGFIYCITNRINGKQYIGQTIKTIEHRWIDHKSLSTKDYCPKYLLYNALKKYGVENFIIKEVEIIVRNEIDEVKSILDIKEKYYINYFNTYMGDGYNMTVGGDINHSFLSNKAVIKYDLDGQRLCRYDSITNANMQTGIDISSIIDCCKHRTNSAGNYIWSYDNELPTISKNTRRKRVCQFTKDGYLVKVWNQISDTKILGNNMPDSVTKCAKGKIETSGGYVWRYYRDAFDKYILSPDKPNVLKYSKDGELLKIYHSVNQASSDNGVSTTSIYNALNNITRTSCGCIWKYE